MYFTNVYSQGEHVLAELKVVRLVLLGYLFSAAIFPGYLQSNVTLSLHRGNVTLFSRTEQRINRSATI